MADKPRLLRTGNWPGLDSPDTFERGQYKHTSDGMITPKMVADFLARAESGG